MPKIRTFVVVPNGGADLDLSAQDECKETAGDTVKFLTARIMSPRFSSMTGWASWRALPMSEIRLMDRPERRCPRSMSVSEALPAIAKNKLQCTVGVH